VRELALHILDLIENSIRAEASVIEISLTADPEADVLRIVVEDNGTGLKVPATAALDPFYTTKSGKRMGLGLSLFRAAAERAGGKLTLGESDLGGASVAADMILTHIDRSPLGDMAGSLSSVVCTNPEIDFRFHVRIADREWSLRVFDLAEKLGAQGGGSLAVARKVMEMIRAELAGSAVLM
jgi:signal transduction histidine kinase